MEDVFIKRYPKIDLHGLDRESARVAVDDFVRDNIVLGNEMIVIIHGKGLGIVKESAHQTLSKNKNVLEYKTDNFNDGVTLVKLKIK